MNLLFESRHRSVMGIYLRIIALIYLYGATVLSYSPLDAKYLAKTAQLRTSNFNHIVVQVDK